jgi:hypothetical protein
MPQVSTCGGAWDNRNPPLDFAFLKKEPLFNRLLGTMRHKYPIAVVGCIVHPVVITWLFFRVRSSSLFCLAMLLLLALWPLWTDPLWRQSQGSKILVRVLAVTLPLLLGLIVFYLSGLLVFAAYAFQCLLGNPGNHF